MCNQLLRGLHKYEADRIDEAILVDDNSRDIDVSNGIELISKLLPVTAIVNETNQGFTRSSNIGLKHACQDESVVFLISTDVQITGKFIERASTSILERKCLLGQRLINHDTGWNTFSNQTFQYIEGFFLATTSDGWNELGLFDESYNPYDYEDVDLSTQARRKGYTLTAMNSPHVKHLGGQSIGYNKAREEITNRNKKYFMEKWL